jgi:hypothetical protein
MNERHVPPGAASGPFCCCLAMLADMDNCYVYNDPEAAAFGRDCADAKLVIRSGLRPRTSCKQRCSTLTLGSRS